MLIMIAMYPQCSFPEFLIKVLPFFFFVSFAIHMLFNLHLEDEKDCFFPFMVDGLMLRGIVLSDNVLLLDKLCHSLVLLS